MRIVLCMAVVLLALPSGPRSGGIADDFSLTLEQIGCLGSCPDYKITIQGDGTVKYEGRYYVHVKGTREKKVPLKVVQRLARKLQGEDFFHWEEKKTVCVDFSETHITVTLNGTQKHVMEGCNMPGNVLKLANEIVKITGVKPWI
jgi:hypothetical protein